MRADKEVYCAATLLAHLLLELVSVVHLGDREAAMDADHLAPAKVQPIRGGPARSNPIRRACVLFAHEPAVPTYTYDALFASETDEHLALLFDDNAPLDSSGDPRLNPRFAASVRDGLVQRAAGGTLQIARARIVPGSEGTAKRCLADSTADGLIPRTQALPRRPTTLTQ